VPIERIVYFDSDGFKLAGTLHLPDKPNPPVVIGSHGLLANQRSQKQISLAHACNQNGMAYFRFDHRGCGESPGDFSKVTSLSARCRDLYHAVKAMQHHSETGPLAGLFGSSFGGTVVLSFAARYGSPALITYAAPINSNEIHHSNIRDNDGRPASAALLPDALAFDISSKLNTIGNILVTHSQNDETVPVSHAHQIYAAVKGPKHLFIFKDGDHRMSNTNHHKQFKAQFIGWLTKQIT
jgi:alpha-beta hydrolase superfamily lysophospholipase